jgi:endoglucanase
MQYPRLTKLSLLLPLLLTAACSKSTEEGGNSGGSSASSSSTGGSGGKRSSSSGGQGGASNSSSRSSGGSGGASSSSVGGSSGGTSSSSTGGSSGGASSSAAGSSGGSSSGGGGSSSQGGSTGGSGGASTSSGGSSGGSGGKSTGTGGSSSAGGTGSGGSTGTGPSGMCASAFFSSDAAALKASEYKAWKDKYTKECPSDKSACVINGGGVYSEGIGYGMLLSANNDDRDLFDKLWKFYTDHYDKNGLMNWSMDACAAPGDNTANAATDGDLDAAMGLVLADKVWGGYASKAKELIGKIKQFETDTCSDGMVLLRPGDKWGGCSDAGNKGKTNPSYFSPGYYRIFATVDTANADFWKKLAADSYTLLAQYQKAMNGLVPEWGYNDGRVEGNYDYNACRTPWRIATDYMWFCTPEAKTFLQAMGTYIDGKGGVTKTGYANNSAFVGAFADAGVAISQAKINSYASDWLGNTSMDDTPYFQATLRRLYLLVAGGQFMSGL